MSGHAAPAVQILPPFNRPESRKLKDDLLDYVLKNQYAFRRALNSLCQLGHAMMDADYGSKWYFQYLSGTKLSNRQAKL